MHHGRGHVGDGDVRVWVEGMCVEAWMLWRWSYCPILSKCVKGILFLKMKQNFVDFANLSPAKLIRLSTQCGPNFVCTVLIAAATDWASLTFTATIMHEFCGNSICEGIFLVLSLNWRRCQDDI